MVTFLLLKWDSDEHYMKINISVITVFGDERGAVINSSNYITSWMFFVVLHVFYGAKQLVSIVTATNVTTPHKHYQELWQRNPGWMIYSNSEQDACLGVKELGSCNIQIQFLTSF